MPLEIEALSAVSVAERRFRREGDAFITLIVKATFAYENGREARLVEPEPLSLDVAEDRDPLLRRAARTARATELAPNLRRGGVSVIGFACAPTGTMARQVDVRLAVLRGDEALVDKRLHVVGDRQSMDAFPDPFEAIPLCDELCFGSPTDPINPRGVGAGANASTLPNILPIDRSSRFANVAPLPMLRTAPLFASFDHHAVEIRSDADWEAYQSAPADQRLMGMREFFGGDERIILEGMDRTAPTIEARLPRVRAVARWARSGRPPRVLELRGDCLVIDAEARRASLTWRGQITSSIDPAERIRVAVALLFGDEREDGAAWPKDLAELPAANLPARGAGAWPSTTQGRTIDLGDTDEPLPPRDAQVGGETITGAVLLEPSAEPSWMARANRARPKPPGPEDPVKAAPIPGAPWSRVHTSKVEAAAWGDETLDPARASALLGQTAPIPPELPREPIAASVMPTAQSLGAPMPPAAPSPREDHPMSRVPLAAPPARLEPARDWASSAPPSVPLTIGARQVAQAAAARAQAELAAAPAELETRPAPVAAESDAKARGVLPPERLAPPPAEPGVRLRSAAPPRDSAARADVAARIEKGTSLEGMSLAGADLSGLDFKERSLARAVLTGARLEGALLARCNLTGAILEEADLTDADLTSAILTRADASRSTLTGAKLDRAQLVDTVLEGARAEGASFRSATGNRTLMKGCMLAGAVFHGASLDRADLTGAELDRADFTGATLMRGRFDDARATGLVLNGARMNDSRWEGARLAALEARGLSAQHSLWAAAKLAEAHFEKADLRGAHLRGAALAKASLGEADLRDADLREADARGATFTKANLEGAILGRLAADGAVFDGARLSGADARDATLAEASLKDASCVRARLDGAELGRADLTRADLRHAFLRDVKLGRADLTQALVDGADLRGAELEGATLYKVDLARGRTT